MAGMSEAKIINASDELKNRIHDEFATLTVLKAAIDANPRIPEGSGEAAKDFLSESMNTLWDQAGDIPLIDIEEVPPELVEYWETINEMVSILFARRLGV